MVMSCTLNAGGVARGRFRGRRLRRGGYEDERQLQLSGANLNEGFIILPSRVRALLNQEVLDTTNVAGCDRW